MVIPILVFTSTFKHALAQSDVEEIVTDRPDITESAIVVPKGSLQAENGLTWTKGRDEALALCQTLLRLGVTDRTELRLFLPSYVQSFSRPTGSSGLTDVSIGFKQQVGPLPGGLDLSLIVGTSVPSGSSDKTTHRLDPFLKIPWSRELSSTWSIGGMASIFWVTEDGRRNFIWEPTFVLERDLSRSLDVFAEFAGDYAQRGGSTRTIHFGTAYRINSTNQVDFHFGFEQFSTTLQRFFAVGYSFRLDHLWRK